MPWFYVLLAGSARRSSVVGSDLVALLCAAQGLADEFVRQHELGVGDEPDGQADDAALGLAKIDVDPDLAVLEALEHAPEALAAVDRLLQFDLGLIAGPVLEVGWAHERAVDPRRGDLEPVGAGDWVMYVEQRRYIPRDGLAILDRQRAVRPLGHHLQRLALAARDRPRARGGSRGRPAPAR